MRLNFLPILILIFSNSNFENQCPKIVREHSSIVHNDTARYILIKARMIDTVSIKKIEQLCDHCALAIRFIRVDAGIEYQKFDLIVLQPECKTLKLNVKNGIYNIQASTEYKGPKTLIISAEHHVQDVLELWNHSLIPDF